MYCKLDTLALRFLLLQTSVLQNLVKIEIFFILPKIGKIIGSVKFVKIEIIYNERLGKIDDFSVLCRAVIPILFFQKGDFTHFFLHTLKKNMLWLSSPKSLICKHLFTKLSQKNIHDESMKKEEQNVWVTWFLSSAHTYKYYTAPILYPWEQNWMNGRASHFSLKSTAACASSLQLKPKIQFSQSFLPFSRSKVGLLHDWLHVSLNQGGSTHSKVGARDPRGLLIAIGVLDDGVLH